MWFNIFGFSIVLIMLIPNIIFAIKNKNEIKNSSDNKILNIIEQIGRYGCIIFMIFNIPYTWFGFWSGNAFSIYLIVNIILLVVYCIIWIICFKQNTIFKALALSIIPSIIFLFSAVMSRAILLLLFAIVFAPIHIIISYKNARK